MKVCLDTNVVLQLFGANAPFSPIRRALLFGRLQMVMSNEMLVEYEEAAIRYAGTPFWQQVEAFLRLVTRLQGIIEVSPTFRFGMIAVDPDDNKFVDCAIVASADFLITEDRHFAALTNSGYRPQPIKPQAFIAQYLLP